MADYLLITPTKIELRFLNAPDEIKDFLLSDDLTKITDSIIHKHFIDEDKTLVLKQLIVLVSLGFISLNDLNFEIAERMFLNHTHANALAKELDGQLFHPLKDLLEKSYKPLSKELFVEADETNISNEKVELEKKTITFEGLGKEVSEPEETLPINVSERLPAEAVKTEENPFILQEEKPIAENAQPLLKKFSFSLGGFFGKKKEGKPSEKPIQAKIELFGETKEDKEKRVVHYSELRTPLGESVFKPAEVAKATEAETPLNGTTPAKKAPWSFKWFGAQSPARDEQKNVPAHEAIGPSFEEKKEEPKSELPKEGDEGIPRLEGNTIDLRK